MSREIALDFTIFTLDFTIEPPPRDQSTEFQNLRRHSVASRVSVPGVPGVPGPRSLWQNHQLTKDVFGGGEPKRLAFLTTNGGV